MKTRIVILTIAALFWTQAAFAQTGQRIASIQREFSLITRNAGKLKKQTKETEAEETAIEATYFSSGGELKKITAFFTTEGFTTSFELFYSSGELIFALEAERRYDPAFMPNMPGSESGKVIGIVERRLYFHEGKMIRFLDGKTPVTKDSEDWQIAENGMAVRSKNLKEGIGLK